MPSRMKLVSVSVRAEVRKISSSGVFGKVFGGGGGSLA